MSEPVTATVEIKVPLTVKAGMGAAATAPIGGNMLSPFYSTAYFVPYSGQQSFTPLASLSGSYWALPFCRAIPRRHRGLADVTHSWYPISRGKRQTQVTWDALLNVFLNPDGPPETQLTLEGNTGGYQMYLTLSVLSNYPAVDAANLYYWWVPSVFLKELPHTIDLKKDPVDPIAFDLMVESNSPAFFLPTDNVAVGGLNPISNFCAYVTSLGWGF